MNTYAQYLGADRRANRLRNVAAAARRAARSLGPDDAQGVADKITLAAADAATKRDLQLSYYQSRRKALKVCGWTVFGVGVAACLVCGAWDWGEKAAYGFLLELALSFLALGALGLAVQGRVLGAAIDARNRVSLSKLQMLAWTVLAVGALAVLGGSWLHVEGATAPLDPPSAALPKPANPATPSKPAPTPPTKDPLIPGNLLLAMGIAATSFVATPLLLSLKSGETPTEQDKSALESARGTSLANQGKVDGRNDPAEASFADIFHGDEVGNATDIDVGKVQQIFITVLLLALYGGAIFKSLADAHGLIRNLPSMSDDFVKLLAISHASYLGYKAVPKTASAPQ